MKRTKGRKIVCALLLLLLFLFGIRGILLVRESRIKENCYLCGSNSQSMIGLYRGRETLGIICVNNWYVIDLKLSDSFQKADNEEGIDVTDTNLGEENCSFSVRSDLKHQIAEVKIIPGKEKQLDQKKLKKRFCRSCQEKIRKAMSADEKHDLIVIDFQTMKLYPLKEEQTIREYEISEKEQKEICREYLTDAICVTVHSRVNHSLIGTEDT